MSVMGMKVTCGVDHGAVGRAKETIREEAGSPVGPSCGHVPGQLLRRNRCGVKLPHGLAIGIWAPSTMVVGVQVGWLEGWEREVSLFPASHLCHH